MSIITAVTSAPATFQLLSLLDRAQQLPRLLHSQEASGSLDWPSLLAKKMTEHISEEQYITRRVN